jgi:hypothetical protein
MQSAKQFETTCISKSMIDGLTTQGMDEIRPSPCDETSISQHQYQGHCAGLVSLTAWICVLAGGAVRLQLLDDHLEV